MGKQNTVHLTEEHHSPTKVRAITCENMESDTGHHVMQNRPGTVRQVCCGLLHMWQTEMVPYTVRVKMVGLESVGRATGEGEIGRG